MRSRKSSKKTNKKTFEVASERKRDPVLYCHVKEDKEGQLLFGAILKKNPALLENLIFHEADIGLVEGENNCLQYAAELSDWDCVQVLINYSGEYFKSNKHAYVHRAGKALLLAAKEDREDIVEALLSLIDPPRLDGRAGMISDDILYTSASWSPSIWHDEDGNSALHWAVKNNNAKICEMFICFDRTQKNYPPTGGDSAIFRHRDKDEMTAMDLAVSLGHYDCARKIARAMSLEYALFHLKDENWCKALLEDISFKYTFTGWGDNLRNFMRTLFLLESFSTRYDDRKKIFYDAFLKFSSEDKKRTFDLIMTEGTALNDFFNFDYKSVSEKYKMLIAKCYANVQALAPTDHSTGVMSTAEIGKGLGSEESLIFIPRKAVSLKINEEVIAKSQTEVDEMARSAESISFGDLDAEESSRSCTR